MNFIEYRNNTVDINIDQLEGFFVGWVSPPSQQKLLQLLNSVEHKIIAYDTKSNKIIGFVYAITDGVLCAYIPLLEVIPEFKGKGVGKELIAHLLILLNNYYMIDLCCDEALSLYYEKKGFKKTAGMIIRNYKNQSGI